MVLPRWLVKSGLGALGITSICLVGLEMSTMERYEHTAGEPAGSPQRWPRTSRIGRQDGHFTLVIFAHPECPCTRASLAELRELLSQTGRSVDTWIQFRRPGMRPAEAQATGLWRTAAGIPGVTLALDRDGNEIRTFGVSVSGQALLYDPAGRLVFNGGLTAARGREGANAGIEAMRRLLRGETVASGPVRTPVFGCSLRTPPEGSSWTL